VKKKAIIYEIAAASFMIKGQVAYFNLTYSHA
jgi:hypothetical protein